MNKMEPVPCNYLEFYMRAEIFRFFQVTSLTGLGHREFSSISGILG